MLQNHEKFMNLAMKEAKLALKEDELPVGVVVVVKDKVWGSGRRTINSNKRLDHGEMMALREALDKNHELADEMTIYTTLEPCVMCFGAIINSRIKRVVYAFEDPYGGATCLKLDHLPKRHQVKFPKIIKGILREEVKMLFKEFFMTTKNDDWNNHLENPLVKLSLSQSIKPVDKDQKCHGK